MPAGGPPRWRQRSRYRAGLSEFVHSLTKSGIDVTGKASIEGDLADQAFNHRTRDEKRSRRERRQLRHFLPGNGYQEPLACLDFTQDFSTFVTQLARRYRLCTAWMLAWQTTDDRSWPAMLGVVPLANPVPDFVREVPLVTRAALAANERERPALRSLLMDVAHKLTLMRGRNNVSLVVGRFHGRLFSRHGVSSYFPLPPTPSVAIIACLLRWLLYLGGVPGRLGEVHLNCCPSRSRRRRRRVAGNHLTAWRTLTVLQIRLSFPVTLREVRHPSRSGRGGPIC